MIDVDDRLIADAEGALGCAQPEQPVGQHGIGVAGGLEAGRQRQLLRDDGLPGRAGGFDIEQEVRHGIHDFIGQAYCVPEAVHRVVSTGWGRGKAAGSLGPEMAVHPFPV
ncbi:hypothetical protein D3C72_1531050 [compost metagenome]